MKQGSFAEECEANHTCNSVFYIYLCVSCGFLVLLHLLDQTGQGDAAFWICSTKTDFGGYKYMSELGFGASEAHLKQ